jgi:hypothetical protein
MVTGTVTQKVWLRGNNGQNAVYFNMETKQIEFIFQFKDQFCYFCQVIEKSLF